MERVLDGLRACFEAGEPILERVAAAKFAPTIAAGPVNDAPAADPEVRAEYW